MENQQTENNTGLQITEQTIRNLNITRKWAKFIAIVNFVFLGLLALVAIFLIIAGAGLGMSLNMPSFPFSIVGIVYLVIIAIAFIPNLYLFKFATNMGRAINLREQMSSEQSFRYLMAYFRFIGILLLISVCIYVLMIIIYLIAGLGAAFLG